MGLCVCLFRCTPAGGQEISSLLTVLPPHRAPSSPCSLLTALPPHRAPSSPCSLLTVLPPHRVPSSPCSLLTVLPPHCIMGGARRLGAPPSLESVMGGARRLGSPPSLESVMGGARRLISNELQTHAVVHSNFAPPLETIASKLKFSVHYEVPENASEAVLESLKSNNFLGEHAPRPPYYTCSYAHVHMASSAFFFINTHFIPPWINF